MYLNDKGDAGPEQIACLVHFPSPARHIQNPAKALVLIYHYSVPCGCLFTGNAENRLGEYLKEYHDPANLPNLDGKIKQANSPSLTKTKWTYQQAILKIPLTLASVVGAYLFAIDVELLNKTG